MSVLSVLCVLWMQIIFIFQLKSFPLLGTKEKLQEFTECTAEALIIDMSIQRKK